MRSHYLIAFVAGISLLGQIHAQETAVNTVPSTAQITPNPSENKQPPLTIALQDKPTIPPEADNAQARKPMIACDVSAEIQQCCSAAQCGGNVLSNRDRHNCKVKSNGKSWHPAARNGEPAVCVKP